MVHPPRLRPAKRGRSHGASPLRGVRDGGDNAFEGKVFHWRFVDTHPAGWAGKFGAAGLVEDSCNLRLQVTLGTR